MVLVLQQSITRSRRAGLLAALGITTGATVWPLAQQPLRQGVQRDAD
jgi:threonine/homoserine/homoserine lactone efflux protein